MIRTKIFFGKSSPDAESADVRFNEWHERHLDCKILELGYNASVPGEHSIFVVYEDGGMIDANYKPDGNAPRS